MKLRAYLAVLFIGSIFLGSTKAEDAPRNTSLTIKKLEELSDQNYSEYAHKALAINPAKWKHAETDNFVVHFRRQTEAQKVFREIEFYLWFVAKTLNATKEQYARKSHVFVFEDESEWKQFLSKTKAPSWAASFAKGDELYLNVRQSAATGRFDSETLAHETTHAVVARLYHGKNWPVWLGEGFAEYMGGASIAARKSQPVKRHQPTLQTALIPVDALLKMQEYPSGQQQVDQFYASSEKLVRFFMNELPSDRFPKFIEAVLAENGFDHALTTIYGDKISSRQTFDRKYERFDK